MSEEQKDNKWLKIKVDKVNLPNGFKLSGLEFSVYDFETLKALRNKIKNMVGEFKKR